MGKLLPRSRFPAPRNADDAVAQLRRRSSAREAGVDAESVPGAAAECETHARTGPEPSLPETQGKLFVFRDPPQSCDLAEPPRRKKKKNFLNLKKSSVAPTDGP